MEVRQYEMLLKRAKVESMKKELDKLSLKKIKLSGFSEMGGTEVDQIFTLVVARCLHVRWSCPTSSVETP